MRVSTCLIMLAVLQAAPEPEGIPFPKDYRSWAHVKTVLVGPQSAAVATEGGFHHIYANERALTGYKTGTFPDGSIVVYNLIETKEAAGNTVEGAERRVDVMVKDQKRFANNAGWGFARFVGGNHDSGKLTAEQQASCLACHARRRDHDYVVSNFRGDVP